ncbi:hypothetical protein GCM10020254_79110 [Streptomyces goshikiensis]
MVAVRDLAWGERGVGEVVLDEQIEPLQQQLVPGVRRQPVRGVDVVRDERGRQVPRHDAEALLVHGGQGLRFPDHGREVTGEDRRDAAPGGEAVCEQPVDLGSGQGEEGPGQMEDHGAGRSVRLARGLAVVGER